MPSEPSTDIWISVSWVELGMGREVSVWSHDPGSTGELYSSATRPCVCSKKDMKASSWSSCCLETREREVGPQECIIPWEPRGRASMGETRNQIRLMNPQRFSKSPMSSYGWPHSLAHHNLNCCFFVPQENPSEKVRVPRRTRIKLIFTCEEGNVYLKLYIIYCILGGIRLL